MKTYELNVPTNVINDDEQDLFGDLDVQINNLEAKYNPKYLYEVLPSAVDQAPLELPEAYLLDMLEIL